MPKRPIGSWFWIAVTVSLLVSLTPWAPTILYPFRLFTTWVHECGHALMTVLVGGRVMGITLAPDGSGLTQSLAPAGRVARGLVASSGYLGAAIVGCLLLRATRVERKAKVILLCLGAFMLLTLVLWMRNVFGFVVVLAWSAALVSLVRKGSAGAMRLVLSLLAVQVALNSVYDIRVLFEIDRGPSDAATMARLFLLPAWFWATTWMAVSIALLTATVLKTRRL
jgi:asparagine N-glycosylation enzyme membrane subunit Stt3